MTSEHQPLPNVARPRWVAWLIALVPVVPPLYLAALACLGHLLISSPAPGPTP
ncbi:hypothetical protein [Deinococcus sp.]|uniref:hypothetical protein n=1 Tax=Deinococcus sp. TaxID=47478 RepID=UPI0025C4AC67|nr:hypothetical protein [Deinococcus sp.]